jgi:hypothetical protein
MSTKKSGRKSIGSYHLAILCIHDKIKWVIKKQGVRVHAGFKFASDRIHCRDSGSARVGNSLTSCVSIKFARNVVQQGVVDTALLVAMATTDLRHPTVQIESDNSSRVMGPHRSGGKHRDLHYRNLQTLLCLAQSLEVRVLDRLRYVMLLLQLNIGRDGKMITNNHYLNTWKTHYSFIVYLRSRGSSVGIATGYGLDGRSSIPARGKRFFPSPQRPQRL